MFKDNIKNIIKIKDTFIKLPSNKIIKIYNVTSNKGMKEGKPKINITTKDSFRKQIIISMSTNNSEVIISQANAHISNINRLFESIESKVSTDFIYSDNNIIIITTNKVAASSNLNIVKRYVKELDNINSNNVINLLEQLGRRAKHFKSLENPKSII